jgi:hypothetical protein
MKIFPSFVLCSLLAISVSSAQAGDRIRGWLVSDGGLEKQFDFEPGKMFSLNETEKKTYPGFVGCKEVNTSEIRSDITVGRVVNITSTRAMDDSVSAYIFYSHSKFNGTTPVQLGKDCQINNMSSSEVTTSPSVRLQRGVMQTLILNSYPSEHTLKLMLE